MTRRYLVTATVAVLAFAIVAALAYAQMTKDTEPVAQQTGKAVARGVFVGKVAEAVREGVDSRR